MRAAVVVAAAGGGVAYYLMNPPEPNKPMIAYYRYNCAAYPNFESTRDGCMSNTDILLHMPLIPV